MHYSQNHMGSLEGDVREEAVVHWSVLVGPRCTDQSSDQWRLRAQERLAVLVPAAGLHPSSEKAGWLAGENVRIVQWERRSWRPDAKCGCCDDACLCAGGRAVAAF